MKRIIGFAALALSIVVAGCNEQQPAVQPSVYDKDGNPVQVQQPQDHSALWGLGGFLLGNMLGGNRTAAPAPNHTTINQTVIRKEVIVNKHPPIQPIPPKQTTSQKPASVSKPASQPIKTTPSGRSYSAPSRSSSSFSGGRR